MSKIFTHRQGLWAIAAVILFFLTYSNHFNNTFHFDDVHVVQYNAYIKNLENIPLFFKDSSTYSAQPVNQQYRPMVSLSLAIDYWLAKGLTPFWFHLSTFLWFCVQCICLFYFFLTIAQKSFEQYRWNVYFALFATVLYAIHPANAETINYISARSDALSTCWLLLGLMGFIVFPKYRSLGLYLFPVIIACLFKQIATIFPALLSLYVLFFERNQSIFAPLKEYVSAIKSTLISWLLIGALIPFLIHMDGQHYTPGGNSFIAYLLTQPGVLIHYFSNFILPIELCADADWPLTSTWKDIHFILGCLFILGALAFAIMSSKKTTCRPIAYGILWFFLSHLPTSVIPLADAMNDHRMFLPNIGLVLALSTLLYHFVLKHEAFLITHLLIFKAGLLGLILVLGGYAYGTFQRNLVWKTDASLWYDVTVKRPENGRGLLGYGLSQLQEGQLENAERYLLKALERSPTYSYIYVYLGMLYDKMGKEELAIRYLDQALQYGGRMPNVLYHYALFYLKRNPQRAEQVLLYAIQISPGDLMSRHLLLQLYWENHRYSELQNQINDTLALSPQDENAHAFLAQLKTI